MPFALVNLPASIGPVVAVGGGVVVAAIASAVIVSRGRMVVVEVTMIGPIVAMIGAMLPAAIEAVAVRLSVITIHVAMVLAVFPMVAAVAAPAMIVIVRERGGGGRRQDQHGGREEELLHPDLRFVVAGARPVDAPRHQLPPAA